MPPSLLYSTLLLSDTVEFLDSRPFISIIILTAACIVISQLLIKLLNS